MKKRTKQGLVAINTQTQQIDVGLVVCSIDLSELSENNVQRIHLIPVNDAGLVVGTDGRAWKYNAENIMANAAAHPTRYPGDYHHASLDARASGAEAPASGWVEPATLTAEANGVWAVVEWTARAANAIREKEFLYLSPVFSVNKKTNETLAFKGFALTHYPNLGDLTPVANAQNLEDEHMEELLERFKYMLNLPELATPEEVLAELEKAIARLRAMLSSGASEAANAQDTNLFDLLTQLESHAAELAVNSQQDLSGFVPRAEFDAVRGDLNAITTEREDARVEAAVNAALDAGLIAPTSLEWAKDLCRSNPESFDKFVTNTQQVIPMGEENHGDHAGVAVLTDAETAVCAQLGLTADEFLKSKKEEVN